MSAQLPTGTVTFLFTDIEGSTRLWESYPEAMKTVLARHDAILHQTIRDHHGQIVKTTGDGCHAAFATAASAVAATLAAQQALLADPWEEIQPRALRVRMGVHSGEAEVRSGDYYGPALNRAERVMAAGHGGQVLVSAATAELLKDALPAGAGLLDLGEHRLKDLVRPEHIFQLVHPALPAEFPPPRSLNAFPNNLPVQPTSFVGRERELAETHARLAGTRLLTLTGSGGTGKTRLGLHLAADVLPEFPDGAWLVELAPLAGPDLVIQAVAAAFGLQSVPGRDLLELVNDYLRGKCLVLVLDNCEHLVEACARLADQLLRTCPDVKIIASSREALGIAGEATFPVPSLALPDPSDLAPQGLILAEAAQLFIARACAANPRFHLTEENAAAIAQICLRLDGIPLALELAAARTRVFSAEQIASRLDDRFRLLTGGNRTALPRQQTLRALIDWSYELLSEPERSLLRRLSVFVGGWTFEAAEALCPDLDVLDLLTQLVNKSLVLVDPAPGGDRYRLLETIRQYARDRLFETGEMAAARDQHFDYFLSLSVEAMPALRGSAAFAWIDRLDPDFDNIRAALEWGQEQRPEDTLRLAGNLFFVWPYRGDRFEALRILQTALRNVEALPEVEGSALIQRNHARAMSLAILGLLFMGLGDSRTAADKMQAAIQLAREGDDRFLLAFSLGMMAILHTFLGDYGLMRSALEESRELFTQLGDRRWLVMALPQLALIEAQAGNWEAYGRYLDQARQGMAQFDHPMMVPLFLGFGGAARVSGNLALAREFYQQSLNGARRVKSIYFQAALQSELVHLDRLEGKLDEAKAGYDELIVTWKKLGHRGAIANLLECLAFIARAQNQATRAARLLGAAEALREESSIAMAEYERPEYEREVSALREAMDEAAFTSAWTEGRGMDVDQAVAYAREMVG